jgi:hypothetical protein
VVFFSFFCVCDESRNPLLLIAHTVQRCKEEPFFVCFCVCVCVLRHWIHAAMDEAADLPKCSSHWSLELFPASVENLSLFIIVGCVSRLISQETENPQCFSLLFVARQVAHMIMITKFVCRRLGQSFVCRRLGQSFVCRRLGQSYRMVTTSAVQLFISFRRYTLGPMQFSAAIFYQGEQNANCGGPTQVTLLASSSLELTCGYWL